MRRPSQWGSQPVEKSQSTALCESAVIPSGMWMLSSVSAWPASISSTLVSGSSLRRAASTQPADPAPTMM
jgi:hypothetical protein